MSLGSDLIIALCFRSEAKDSCCWGAGRVESEALNGEESDREELDGEAEKTLIKRLHSAENWEWLSSEKVWSSC